MENIEKDSSQLSSRIWPNYKLLGSPWKHVLPPHCVFQRWPEDKTFTCLVFCNWNYFNGHYQFHCQNQRGTIVRKFRPFALCDLRTQNRKPTPTCQQKGLKQMYNVRVLCFGSYLLCPGRSSSTDLAKRIFLFCCSWDMVVQLWPSSSGAAVTLDHMSSPYMSHVND